MRQDLVSAQPTLADLAETRLEARSSLDKPRRTPPLVGCRLKLKAKWIGLALTGTALTGCGAILGLDEFTEGAGGSGTGTTTGAGGANSSTTTSTGASTSSGSSSGATTSAGTGGAPACAGTESLPCDTGLKGVCAPGTKTCAAG